MEEAYNTTISGTIWQTNSQSIVLILSNEERKITATGPDQFSDVRKSLLLGLSQPNFHCCWYKWVHGVFSLLANSCNVKYEKILQWREWDYMMERNFSPYASGMMVLWDSLAGPCPSHELGGVWTAVVLSWWGHGPDFLFNALGFNWNWWPPLVQLCLQWTHSTANLKCCQSYIGLTVNCLLSFP